MKLARDSHGRVLQDEHANIIHVGDIVEIMEEPSFSSGGRKGLKLKVIELPVKKSLWGRLFGKKYACVRDEKNVSWALASREKIIRRYW